jgi:hypothetical protein
VVAEHEREMVAQRTKAGRPVARSCTHQRPIERRTPQSVRGHPGAGARRAGWRVRRIKPLGCSTLAASQLQPARLGPWSARASAKAQ